MTWRAPRGAASGRRTLLAAAAGLVLAVAAALFEPLFQDRLLLAIDSRVFPPFSYHAVEGPPRAMNFLSLDLISWLIPERLAQIEAFSAGRAPLWTAGEGMGQPLLATLGDAPYYPARLLDLVLPALRAMAVSLALHLLVLGLGTHAVMRRGGLHPAAAWLGAVVMMLSGYVTAHFQAPLFVNAIAWLPWMHLACARLAERPTAARAGALGLVIGASFLAGFPQISCISLYAALILAPPRTPRAAACAAAAALLGAAVSAVHLLPATELLGESWRAGGWSAEVLRAKGLSWPWLIGFLLPGFFGSPVADMSLAVPVLPSAFDFPSYVAWQTPEVQNSFEDCVLYAGLIPLALALSGCLRRGRPRRETLGLLAVLALAAAPPVLADLLVLLPGLRHGSPKRVLFLAAYAVAWLSALEVDRLARAGAFERARGLLVAAVALGALGLVQAGPFERWLLPGASDSDHAWFRDVVARDLRAALAAAAVLGAAWAALRFGRRPLALGLLLAGSAAELVVFARHVNPYQEPAALYRETPAITWLRQHGAADHARIVGFADRASGLVGAVPQVFGLRSCNAMASLLPRRPGELLRALEPDCVRLDNPAMLGPLAQPRSLASPILDLVGARYVVAGISGYQALGSGDPALGVALVYMNEAERVAIYERRSALPPAFLVEELRVLREAGARLGALADPAFEPARVAVLEGAQDEPRTGLAGGSAAARRVSPEEIEVDVAAGGPAFLVVTETHLPGWRCEVDGAPSEVVRADHAFLGVPLPAGARRVRLLYAPRSFTAGWALSLAGLAACAGLMSAPHLRRLAETRGRSASPAAGTARASP